jgi:hypothetical protein
LAGALLTKSTASLVVMCSITTFRVGTAATNGRK